jgi:hypothetical protein
MRVTRAAGMGYRDGCAMSAISKRIFKDQQQPLARCGILRFDIARPIGHISKALQTMMPLREWRFNGSSIGSRLSPQRNQFPAGQGLRRMSER